MTSDRRKFGFSASMVVALIALVAAISGVATATPAIRHQHRGKVVGASSGRGARGLRGLRGPRGATGADGVVPQIVVVQSEHLSLKPGQNTNDIDPGGFKASCPDGYTVLGTGFDASIGNADLVISAGTFVGGFIEDDTAKTIGPVFLQATCGVVPDGASSAAVQPTSEAAYRTMLKRIVALHR
jgi:hypothetical protein